MANQQIGAIKKNTYLTRYAYPEVQIKTPPHPLLDLIVTIPCFNEPDLIGSLHALEQCERNGLHIEVIIVINEPENAPESISKQNRATYHETLCWSLDHYCEQLKFHVIYKNDLPAKHAGVGLSRKIAMDEAVRRFEYLKNPEGVIICFDADSQCDNNYLEAIANFFNKNPKAPGCSIYFEHPLLGEYAPEIYQAIIDYELYLRYYVNALRYAGFPYAYETIGSSMAIRSSAYQKQGGMNKRKAGEDFYFLHKIIPLGNFGEVNNTKVIPSPRRSDRVPFGTGKAVNDWLEKKELLTYAPRIFDDLKIFLNNIHLLYQIEPVKIEGFITSQPPGVKHYLESVNFHDQMVRINDNSAAKGTFFKQFYQWFDGFRVLKYVHFARDYFYPNISIESAATELLLKLNPTVKPGNAKELLITYRIYDKNSGSLC